MGLQEEDAEVLQPGVLLVLLREACNHGSRRWGPAGRWPGWAS